MKKFCKLLVILLAAVSLMGCEKVEEEKTLEIYSHNEGEYDGKEFKLENDRLLLELDPLTTRFTVTDKQNGKVWYSTAKDASNDAAADVASKNELNSNFIVKYSTSQDTKPILTSNEHSVENRYYTLEQRADEIVIKYSIGRIKKTYYIPIAVPEERYKEFYDKMERSYQKKLDDAYRTINIEKLLPNDDKSELLSLYPDLETTNVVVLRDSTKDFRKEQMVEWFAEVGYTIEDYENDLLYYENATSSDAPQVNMTVYLRLKDDRLEVEIPNEEIEYKTEYPVYYIAVLPFFGSGDTNTDGYLFVPEGSGAIINFNNGKQRQSGYYSQLYGWDYGNKRDVVVDETRAMFPVYGICNDGASFISVVDEHSASANIEANVSGLKHSYNYAYISYDMIHSSKMDISGKSDKIVMAFEKNLPEGSIKQEFIFLDSDSYVDMATAYREYLVNKYPTLSKNTDADLPVYVEFIAAIERVKQIAGVPVKRPEILTSFKDAKAILQELTANGYSNLSVRYTGWMNGGLEHSIPNSIKLTSGMGGKSALTDLISYANGNDIDLYLSGHVENVYDSNIFDGYLQSRDVAKYISREVVETPVYSFIFYSDVFESRMQHHFLLRPSVSIQLMQNMADYAKNVGAGVGFEDVGYMLSGDYNLKRTVTREAVLSMQTTKLSEIRNSGTKVMVTSANQYVVPYSDIMTDVDLSGKDCNIFDEKIPFYEIAIHGLSNYTGLSMNLCGDAQSNLLKSAECGAGLSFTYFAESADILQDTEYMEFFAADYNAYKNVANEYYTRYKKEMAGLNNQYIINHEILADGVSVTTYENGTKVYVNYGINEYVGDTVTVPARDYLVERSGK